MPLRLVDHALHEPRDDQEIRHARRVRDPCPEPNHLDELAVLLRVTVLGLVRVAPFTSSTILFEYRAVSPPFITWIWTRARMYLYTPWHTVSEEHAPHSFFATAGRPLIAFIAR